MIRYLLAAVIFPVFFVLTCVGLGPWTLRTVQSWQRRRLAKKLAQAIRQNSLQRGGRSSSSATRR